MDTSSTADGFVPEVLVAAAAVAVAIAGAWWMPGADATRASADAADETTQRDAEPETRRPIARTARETASPRTRTALPGHQGADDRERLEYKPAVLQIVTNFKKADANINGIPYPEYVEPGTEPGMVLPAGGPYNVEVTYNGNTKSYTLSLDPYEIRYLMVELSGFKGGSPAPSTERNTGDSADQTKEKNGDSKGRVTVYSKPKGGIKVDGNSKGQKTPGTIKVEPGEHDIQVEFEGGETSESKSVRVREGSRIKLFFRKNDDDDEGGGGDNN